MTKPGPKGRRGGGMEAVSGDGRTRRGGGLTRWGLLFHQPPKFGVKTAKVNPFCPKPRGIESLFVSVLSED